MNHHYVSYEENQEFDNNEQWHIWRPPTPKPEDSVGLHYAKTLEINILHNVVVDAYIGGNHYYVEEDCVFFIMPNVVHSFLYEKNSGTMTSIKINLEQINPVFNICEFLSRHKIEALNFPIYISDHEKAEAIFRPIEESNEIDDFILSFLNFFSYLKEYLNSDLSNVEQNIPCNAEVRAVITWTRQNFKQKISIDEVSALFGYSKFHFCRKFKNATGITYMTFLNSVRIHHAKGLLEKGESITQVCDECGFEDSSYFIQLFKKNFGITPKKFAEQWKQNKS